MTSANDRGGDQTGVEAGGAASPTRIISDSLAKPLAKRFYSEVQTGSAAPFQILLDGRAIKTPKKRPLGVPTKALAEAIADEWRAQATQVDPARMPLTRFANTAIDAVADEREAVAADIVAYAGSDLVCYRAESPEELIAQQARHWDPVVEWAEADLHARFAVVRGVMPVEQPESALAAVAETIAQYGEFRLTALHVLTTLTGSALLALAIDRRALSPEDVWSAAHVDEDYQISLWGEDAEAAARRRARRAEFDAAVRWLGLLR